MGIEIDSQLVNLKLEGVGLITKDNLIIYTKQFGIKKDMNYTYLGDIDLLEEVIKEYNNLFGKKVTFNIIEKIIQF